MSNEMHQKMFKLLYKFANFRVDRNTFFNNFDLQ